MVTVISSEFGLKKLEAKARSSQSAQKELDTILEELVQLRKRETDARARCAEAEAARVAAAEALSALRARELLDSAGAPALLDEEPPPRLLKAFPEAVRANAQLAALLAQAEKLASELGHPAPGSGRSVGLAGTATPKVQHEEGGEEDMAFEEERKRALDLLPTDEDSITLTPAQVLAMRKALEPSAKRSRKGY